MEQLNDNNKNTILEQSEYLLFYFTASWCQPCQKIKPNIIKLANGLTSNNIKFYMIDIDSNDELTEICKIESVPTFVLIKNKEIINQCKGTNIINVADLIKPYC